VWSSLRGIVLFGYDTGIAGGVVTQTGFQKDFGYYGNTKRKNDVSSNVVSVLQAGAFFGALFSAPISDAIGRRWSLFMWSLIFSVGAAVQTAAKKGQISYIYAGRVVAGLGIGAISAVAPAYVSECAPKEIRGRITGQFQVMVAIGVMLSYFINRKSV
jgi:MFS family permease